MQVHEFESSAADLHALAMPDDGPPRLWVLRPSAPALVMGSAQRPPDFDSDLLRADGVDLAPRRSGGGAVYIEPAAIVWVDVLAPRGSAYWSDDLGKTFLKVGAAWQRALQQLGVRAEVFSDAPDRAPEARLACWAGLGWGEVTVAGAKVVGLSQRRTRWGARIQGMAVIDGGAGRVTRWLAGVDEATRTTLQTRIGAAVVPVDRDALETAVVDALLGD